MTEHTPDLMDPHSALDAAVDGVVLPPLSGRRAALRSIQPKDQPFLHALTADPYSGLRWRHRGYTPSPDVLARELWDDVLAQFIVESPASREPLGLVKAYAANTRHGYATVGITMAPGTTLSGVGIEAMVLFVNFLFAHWNFRKLYAESLGFSYPMFASGAGTLFEVEGVLRGHEYFAGRYWDLYLLAFHRERVQPIINRWLRVLVPERTVP